MRVTADPPLHQWTIPSTGQSRAELAAIVNARADRIGSARLDPDKPILATGHQAYFWHPGILAKFLAVSAAARRLSAQTLHVVVDQDVYDPLRLDVPVQVGDRLEARTVRLARCDPNIPPACQPPVHPVLDAIPSEPLRQAWQDLPTCQSLAEQVALVLDRLMSPLTGSFPLVMASELLRLPGAGATLDAMYADPRKCVGAYNEAVRQYPGVDLTLLAMVQKRVELPLWSLHTGQTRRRVYADMPRPEHPAPRALLLTALMRRFFCDLFVHGVGGGRYDRVTEAWCDAWLGWKLAPMAVVTADLYLNFDVPLARRADLDRALWRRHHLPHNLDRELNLSTPEALRKRALLSTMSRASDRHQRRAAFDEIHRLNAALCARHAPVLQRCEMDLARAKLGVANYALARRRDWCIVLYEPGQLRDLAAAFNP